MSAASKNFYSEGCESGRKDALIAHGFVIRLASGRLWKNFRASGATIFSTLENAEATMAGFSGRGALANPKIMRLSSGPCEEGAIKVDGYWMVATDE